MTHIDRGALKYLIEAFDLDSMIDIGCGTGHMVKFAQDKGLEAVGIDGDVSLINTWKRVGISYGVHDYSQSPLGSTPYDLCWAVEFLEHINEKYLDNVFETINNCQVVCMTHALPNARGYNHVNCQPEDYWVTMFESHGFELDETATQKVREVSTMSKDFMRNTGNVFIHCLACES